jgi:hypothetical protein
MRCTDLFAEEKIMGFLASLTPEQRVAFAALTSPTSTPIDEPASLFSTPPPPLPVGKFYHPGASAAAPPEVTLLATLMTIHFGADNIKGLQRWVLDVEHETARVQRLRRHGEVWAPPPGSSLWANGGQILGPYDQAVSVRMGKGGVVETAAKVLSSWQAVEGCSSPLRERYSGRHRLVPHPDQGQRQGAPAQGPRARQVGQRVGEARVRHPGGGRALALPRPAPPVVHLRQRGRVHVRPEADEGRAL